MKRYMAALVLFAAFIWIIAPEAFGYRALTINLPEAYLLEGPGVDYRILCKVTRDEPLTVLSWGGDWFQVRRANGMTGWLNRVALSPEDSDRYPNTGTNIAPPESRGGTTNPSGGGFLNSIRRGFRGSRDDTLTASAGGRGIVTETDSGVYAQDYQAVRFMESIVVSDSELDWFIASGGLSR
jgi:uncharacterized protein YgiM (DUF1202 family)